MKKTIIILSILSFLFSSCSSTTNTDSFFGKKEIRKEEVSFARLEGIVKYEGKPFTGIVYELYGNENRKKQTEYKNGIKHGKEIIFYENGEKKEETEYGNKEKHGKAFKWYENGQIEEEEEFFNEKPHGKHVGWYENGNKRYEVEWNKGKIHGLSIHYDEKGNKKNEFNYENNILKMKKYYYKNGNKKEEIEHNGKEKYGKYKYYYENGQLGIKGNFKNDKPIDKWISYYKNGQKRFENNVKKENWGNTLIFYWENGKKAFACEQDNTGISGDNAEKYKGTCKYSHKDNNNNGRYKCVYDYRPNRPEINKEKCICYTKDGSEPLKFNSKYDYSFDEIKETRNLLAKKYGCYFEKEHIALIAKFTIGKTLIEVPHERLNGYYQ